MNMRANHRKDLDNGCLKMGSFQILPVLILQLIQVMSLQIIPSATILIHPPQPSHSISHVKVYLNVVSIQTAPSIPPSRQSPIPNLPNLPNRPNLPNLPNLPQPPTPMALLHFLDLHRLQHLSRLQATEAADLHRRARARPALRQRTAVAHVAVHRVGGEAVLEKPGGAAQELRISRIY